MKQRDRGPSPWKALKRTVKGPAPYVIQAGAHTGAELRPFKTMWPNARIDAFEPLPSVLAELTKEAQKYSGVRIFNRALGASEGKMPFHVAHQRGTSSRYEINEDSLYFQSAFTETERIDVEVTTLDSFAGDRMVDLLYSDTQGSELSILWGAERMLAEKRIAALYLEVFFVDLYKGAPLYRDIRRELEGHGYRLEGMYCIAKRGRIATGQMIWGDALFVKGKGD